MTTALPGEDGLLQALLAAEHATIYGYGVLGARLDDEAREQAQLADDEHRASRDALLALLTVRGVPAPAPEAAYDVVATGPGEALALAVRLEEGLALRWRDLVAGTDDAALRRLAAARLTAAALRATRWRASAGTSPATRALPGTAP